MSASGQGVSFLFSKTKDSKVLKDSVIRDDSTKEINKETDFIKSVQDNQISGTLKKPEKKELVIPLINKNQWRIAAKKNDGKENENKKPPTDVTQEKMSLEQQAVTELLAETKEEIEGFGKDKKDLNMEIPLLMQNQVPEGYETDDKLDASLRADQSTLEDYESVPIDQFGMAMLRGMGWTSKTGIGGKNQKSVAPVEVTLRPKGLGLGANLTKKSEKVAKDEKGEELKVVSGACVKITQGSKKGQYGQVEGLDDEAARVLIKLTLGGDIISVNEIAVEPVTRKEYQQSSKVINKEKYEKYKQKSDEKLQQNGDMKSGSEEDEESEDKHRKHKERRREKEKKRKKKERSEHSPSNSKHRKTAAPIWVRPSLRVRCIDPHYKYGRYYNSKMVVIDVLSEKHCVCQSSEGRLLEGVDPTKLETVIPKLEPAYAMVVKGTHRGEKCKVLKRNKEKCRATVQFLDDFGVLKEFDYDDICEYVGNVAGIT